MLGKDLLLCLFISLAFGASLSWGHEELKAVIQFTRHGARPSKEFIYRNGLFSEKLDELSRLGTGTSMIVGQNMRKRYVTELKFLSSNYNRNEFQAKADSGPKIKQSAHCIIKGMYADLRLPCMPGYPDSDANKLNLVITDRNNDRLLNPTHTCKPIEQKVHFMKKDSEICRNYETPLRRTLFRQIQDKFNAVAEPSLKLAELRHLKDVAKIHDTYVTNKLHQKMIPNFSVFERQLEEVMLYFYYKIKFGDTTVKKAAVTELYTEWRDIINSAISNRSVPKLALYVGHQSQMMNILGTLWSYGTASHFSPNLED